jgi:hypothetical protein
VTAAAGGSAWGIVAIQIAGALMVAGCNTGNTRQDGPQSEQFTLSSLAKSDIGRVIEVHVREARSCLRTLTEKLYRRNPRELAKSGHADVEENLARLFDTDHDWRFAELGNVTGADAIRLALSPDFGGDRVFAFMAGMSSMIMASYRYKTHFYILDTVDPQSLYNSARNMEIAIWKLEHDVDPSGEPWLYSNSRPGEVENLSFERLFGKLIELQDTMALIAAGKYNRIITRAVQNIATAVFLPVF